MKKAYTIGQIERAYFEWDTKTALRIQKQGKWELTPLNGTGIPRIDGTKAAIVKIRDFVAFPTFLRENG